MDGGIKDIWPNDKFYSLYSREQVKDIVNNLEQYQEVPRQYNYFGKGAGSWNEYVKSMSLAGDLNIVSETVDLLSINFEHISSLTHNSSKVNVIDVGAGNAYPVKYFLQNLIDVERLNCYVALDISLSMLELAKNNIKLWFNDSIHFHGYEYDVTKSLFPDICLCDKRKSCNVVLLLGGTIANLRDPDIAYKMIIDSMGYDDLLVYVGRVDTEEARGHFSFNYTDDNALSLNHRTVFELMGLSQEFYDVEKGYDELSNQRYIRIRLKVSVRLNVMGKHVMLYENSRVLVWRGTHYSCSSLINRFEANKFDVIHVNESKSQDYVLILSRKVTA